MYRKIFLPARTIGVVVLTGGLFAFCLLALPVLAAPSVSNVGIIPGNIWYSSYPLQEGVEVGVYTAIWNGSDFTVQGRVAFRDNDRLITEAPFLIGRGKLEEVSIRWVPLEGEHRVTAAIVEVGRVEQGGDAPAPVSLASTVTAAGEISVAAPPPPPIALPAGGTAYAQGGSGSTAGVESTARTALGALATAADAIGSFASSSVRTVASAAAQVFPASLTERTGDAGEQAETFREAASSAIDAKKEEIRLELAAKKAAENAVDRADAPRGALTQAGGLASVAPIRWLTSAYRAATSKLSEWALGDLPSKVTAAEAGRGSGVKKPFQYAAYFGLASLGLLFRHAWLFWLGVAIVLFILLRWLYRKLFRRQSY